MLCWMKYEIIGLAASFLICLLPIVKCSKKYWCGSEEFGLDGYGMYHESVLFRLTKRKRK
ncbi:MAG: hypothetical protein DRN66_00675 [Candidatus Nanohalarchaeota archaeon]|nr:MAG: hypothetical protein DRN66_00675 [Candidatus Nanohaloarchaeota archaeon]